MSEQAHREDWSEAHVASEVSRIYSRHRRAPPETAAELGLMSGFPPSADRTVTVRNWMDPPFNRWSFQHVEELLPAVRFPRGSSHSAIERRLGEIAGFEFESVTGQAVSVAEHLAASHTDSFLVMQNGRLVYEHYANGQRPETPHLMLSCTKSMFGLLAEVLIDEALLDANTPVAAYLPELSRSAFADATLRQVMNMAVSIDYVENYADPMSSIYDYAIAIGWVPPHEGTRGWPSVYPYLEQLGKRGPHGGFFHYITPVTEVLGWIIDRVTGTSCATLFNQRIWGPLGTEFDAYLVVDPWGKTLTAGGFCATPRDLGRFANMIAHRGVVSGRQVIGDRTLRRILGGGEVEHFMRLPDCAIWAPGGSYISQWYVLPNEAMIASGVYGQYIFADPGSETVIIKQSSMPAKTSYLDVDTVRLMRAVAKHRW